MKDVHYSISTSAPKEKVWNIMLGENTYREWANIFMTGSYFIGTWKEGSTMDFLAPDADGNQSGMRARVVDNVPYEFVSLEHLSELKGEEETPFDKEGASFENYTFSEQDGTTEVSVDLLNIPDEWVDMMGEMWSKALATLKQMVEA